MPYTLLLSVIYLSFGLCKKANKLKRGKKNPEAYLQMSGDEKLLLAAAFRKEQQKHSYVKTWGRSDCRRFPMAGSSNCT